jgi:hypothetical protein
MFRGMIQLEMKELEDPHEPEPIAWWELDLL